MRRGCFFELLCVSGDVWALPEDCGLTKRSKLAATRSKGVQHRRISSAVTGEYRGRSATSQWEGEDAADEGSGPTGLANSTRQMGPSSKMGPSDLRKAGAAPGRTQVFVSGGFLPTRGATTPAGPVISVWITKCAVL